MVHPILLVSVPSFLSILATLASPLAISGISSRSSAAVGIVASNMWPGYWMSTRLVVVVWPTLSAALAWGLTLRAIRRGNRDQQLPAYDSVTQALDEIRERRDLLALTR